MPPKAKRQKVEPANSKPCKTDTMITTTDKSPFESIIGDLRKNITRYLIQRNEIGRKYRLKDLLSFRLVSKGCRDLANSFVEDALGDISWKDVSDYILQNTLSKNSLKGIYFSFRSETLKEANSKMIWKSLSEDAFANLTELRIKSDTSTQDIAIDFLPPQLTSLALTVHGAEGPTDKDLKDITDRLTKLTSLSIYSISCEITDLSFLPTQLTELKLCYLANVTVASTKHLSKLTKLVNLEISLGDKCSSECIGFLPRTLTRLVYNQDEMNSMDDVGVTLLPPKLKTLRIGGDDSCPHLSTSSLSKFPETITFLDIRSARIGIRNLNSNITHLTIWECTKKTVLPPRLEFLSVDCIDNPPQFVKKLPATLKILLVGDATDIKLKDLPKSLQHFEVKAIADSNLEFSHLPRGLLYLKGGSLEDGVKSLPPNLIKLGIRTPDLNFKGVEKIPASIRCLALYKDMDLESDTEDCFAKDFSRIPKTVTHLKLNRITIWKNLKPAKFPSTIERLCIYCSEELENVPATVKELKSSEVPKKVKGIRVKKDNHINSDDEEEKEPTLIRSFSTKIVNSFDKQK